MMGLHSITYLIFVNWPKIGYEMTLFYIFYITFQLLLGILVLHNIAAVIITYITLTLKDCLQLR